MDEQLLQEIMARSAVGPMFGRVNAPGMPFDLNIPALQSNPLLGILAQMLASPFTGGGMPTQFMPMQNVFDQWRVKDFWNQRNQAVQMARGADEQTYIQMIRGIAQMTGTRMGLEEERLASGVARDIGGLMPFMVQFAPDLADQLHGSRGSAMVMAHYLSQGGRYAVDPVTGRIGMSGESAGFMAREIQSRFFGPGADITSWRGLSGGQVGQLYDEMQTRGLMGRSIGTYSNEEQNRLMADSEKKPIETIEQLRRDSPTEFDANLRMFDVRRNTDRLKSMAGVVSAMRDIFGDMGRPNAPMKEIIEGLNMLTQGGLATMAPGEMERIVRTTQSLATQTGMGIQAMTGLTAQGAALASQIGLDRVFAVTATQGAAAFGAAFRDVGRGDISAWGRKSLEEITMRDQELRLRGANSTVGNQIGATMRLAEERGFKEGSPLAALADAIRNGQTEFVNPITGEKMSVDMDNAKWMALAEQSGLDPRTANSVLMDKYSNQEYTFKFGGSDIVRQLQGRDIQRLIAQEMNAGLVGAATAAGASTEDARNAAGAVSPLVAKTLQEMSAEDRRVAGRRNKILADKIKTSFAERGITITDQQALDAAITGWGDFEQRIRQDPAYKWADSAQNMLDLMDPEVMKRQQVQTQQARVDATMRKALAGLGQSGPLRRLSDVIQNPTEDFGSAIAEILNVQDPVEIMKRIAKIDPKELGKVGDREALALQAYEMTALQKEYENIAATEKDPAKRAQRQESISRSVSALRAGGEAAKTEAERVREEYLAANPNANGSKRTDSIDDLLRNPTTPPELKSRLLALKLAGGGGYDDRAGNLGYNTKVKVGEQDIEEIMAASERTLDGVRSGSKDTEEGKDIFTRSADQFVSGKKLVSQMLNDEASIEQLGAGGFDLVQKAYEGYSELELMARKKGFNSVQDLLASGDKEALAIQERITSGMRAVKEKMKLDPSARPKMTEEERNRFKDYQSKNRRSDDDLNAEAIERVVKTTGSRMSDEEAKRLADSLGSGEDAAAARRELDQAVEAKERLDKMAKDQGVSVDKVQGREADELRRKASGLLRIREVGKGGEGTGEQVVSSYISETVKSLRPKDEENVDSQTARPQTVRLAQGTTITVEINGQRYPGRVTGGVGYEPIK
jgi:hypothetical protein